MLLSCDRIAPGEMRRDLARRLRQVRTELFGGDGVRAMAERLGIPPRTWCNYEAGVTVPGEILLRFLELTRTEPRWLLRGVGPRCRNDARLAEDAPISEGTTRHAARTGWPA